MLAAGVISAGAAIFLLQHHKGDFWTESSKRAPATVFVTVDDCRRSYSDGDCRAFVMRAVSLHAKTAPWFASRETCEFAYGNGRCKPLQEGDGNTSAYQPAMVAMVVGDTLNDVLPLYLAPVHKGPKTSGVSRAVYFDGNLVGTISRSSFGGADLPVLTDAHGTPLSTAAVATLSHR